MERITVVPPVQDLPSCSGRELDESTTVSFSARSVLRLERHPSRQASFDEWLSSSPPKAAAAATAAARPRPRQSRGGPLPFASMSVSSSAASTTNRGRAAQKTLGAPLFASATRGASAGGRKKKDGSTSSSNAPSSRTALNYLRHLAAGAASCAVARTTLAPLERMKLEQVLHGAAGASIKETAERVWRSGTASSSSPSTAANAAALRFVGGVSAFWRGNGVNLLRTCPHKAVNFFAFDTYRSALLTARRARGRKERAERRRRKLGKQEEEEEEDEGGKKPKLLRLPRISLFAKKSDDAKHHHHHIHGGSPAPTTALFEDSDSDAEEEFGAAERFAAGAMAGATATTICFPLDVLRTRVLLAAPAAASSSATAAAATAASAFAAASSASSAAARPSALLPTLRSIVAKEGFGALYSGLAPALAATGPSGAIFYGTYDVLKHLTLRSMERRQEEEERKEAAERKGKNFFRRAAASASSSSTSSPCREPPRMTAQATLACGAAAGAAAELAMYPMEVVRRRMQVASMRLAAAGAGSGAAGAGASSTAALASATTFRGAAASLFRERGVAGLYAGVGPTMLQVLPSAALSYYAYEVFKSKFGVVGGVQ